jgi:hypothetical protein
VSQVLESDFELRKTFWSKSGKLSNQNFVYILDWGNNNSPCAGVTASNHFAFLACTFGVLYYGIYCDSENHLTWQTQPPA